IYVNNIDFACQWSGWREEAGCGSTDRALTSAIYWGGTRWLYLFMKGMNDRVYVNTFDWSHWSGWKEVPGSGTTDQALATTGNSGQLYLFMKGMNDRVYVNILNQLA